MKGMNESEQDLEPDEDEIDAFLAWLWIRPAEPD